MSYDPYSPDRFYRPIHFTSDNNTVVVTEDPGGANTRVEASLPLDITGKYYAVDSTDPSDITLGPSETITVLDDLEVIPLYGHLARQLRLASSETYKFKAATPTGSDLTNSGLELESTETFRWEFSDSAFTLNPRYLGYERGRSTDSSASADLVAPYSRWGALQTPTKAHDKHKTMRKRGFSSSSEAGAQSWSWGKLDRIREHEYINIASPHLYAHGRASNAELAGLAGLPVGDHNNNLEDFWRLAQIGTEQRVIVHQDEGESDLALSPATKSHNVANLHDMPEFSPPSDTDRKYANERYDLIVRIACEAPEKYDNPDQIYQH